MQGTMMFAAGIIGMFVCMVVLCVLPGIFKKQRKEMLDKIEQEL